MNYKTVIARSYVLNELIDENSDWSDSTAFLSKSEWDCCFTGLGYNCSRTILSSFFTFLGVKMELARDTMYGWIKVKSGEVQSAVSITIDSYAGRDRHTGFSDYKDREDIAVYPDPSAGVIRFLNAHRNSFVVITNSLSQMVYTGILYGHPIDMGTVAEGLYFYLVEDQHGSFHSGRFIISGSR